METAERNKISNRINIKCKAEKYFYRDIPTEQLVQSTVLIDIEGAELDIIDRKLFHDLNSSNIIVELHPWTEGFRQKMSNIIVDSADTHEINELFTSSRDLSSIREVAGFQDSYRWLLCSEGRPTQMSWLHFKPRS